MRVTLLSLKLLFRIRRFVYLAAFSRSASNPLPGLLPFKLLVSMNASIPNQTWCSKCKAFRNPESFERNKSGKTKKQCNRHGKKRDLDAVFDDWDAFETQLSQWNRPVGYLVILFFSY
jgi:hypothetical protein